MGEVEASASWLSKPVTINKNDRVRPRKCSLYVNGSRRQRGITRTGVVLVDSVPDIGPITDRLSGVGMKLVDFVGFALSGEA